MRKFTLLTSVLLTAPFSMSNVSAQCVATQDCATLGYTETSCENGGIKCPFGNAWACKSDGTTDCTYRTIYFSDGSCGEQLIKGKTAIGVVVYDENNEKWIMALDNAASNVKWSTEYVDVPEITNYIVEIAAVSDLKSCENTEAMLALGESKYPAAAAAKNYAPAGAESTKGKWCLPSAGIWNMVNYHRAEIDAAISRASGTSLSGANYWSSSEYSSKYAWRRSSSGGLYYDSFDYYSKDDDYYGTPGSIVRPVMKI